jgi:hypothetical protein
LLADAGRDGIDDELVAVGGTGFEAQADWANLETPETYLGSEQGQSFASGDEPLRLNQLALSGDWTVERRASVLNAGDGRIVFRFHARDVHLVMRAQSDTPVPFRVLVDGEPPGEAHGLDVDEEGNGTLVQPRLYQLVRERGAITDRTFEITFLAPGVEAYAFTFG